MYLVATTGVSLSLVPSGIRVVDSHRLCKLCRVRAEVLFVNCSGFVDNKRHYTRGAVLHRISDDGKACAHLSVDDIFFGSATCMSSLACKDAEHIPIERHMLTNLFRRKILARVRNERIDRAISLIVGTLPVQTVVLAFIANQFLCELIRQISWRAGKVLLFRVDQFMARIHGGNFIFAYAAEENLIFAFGRVEIPCTVIVRQGNWKRPILSPNNQRHLAVWLGHESMHLLVFGDESDTSIRILQCIAGRKHILSGRSEGAQWRFFVLPLHGGKELAAGFFSRRKSSLPGLLSEHWARYKAQRKYEDC